MTLAWMEPEDDGGCKIGTYIVEYYRVSIYQFFFSPIKLKLRKLKVYINNDCFKNMYSLLEIRRS